MQLITYVSALLGAFLILVAVHEYGHFVAARKLGVKVLRFSIGLGPIVWRRVSKGGTEFAISSIPLGGYIAMLDTRTHEVPSHEEHQAFDRVAPWRQIVIASAGPLANLVLAVVLFWAVSFNGVQAAVPYVGQVQQDSPAYASGLRGGEEIVAVDGVPVAQWMDVYRNILKRVGDTGTLTLEISTRSGESHSHEFQLENWLRGEGEPDVLAELGIRQGVLPVVQAVEENSPADIAGLMEGDRFVIVDGTEVLVWQEVVDIIQASPSTELDIVIERDGLRYPIKATPSNQVAPDGSIFGRLGVGPRVDAREIAQGPLESLAYATSETWDFTVLTVTSIKKMITGDMDTSNLAGPIAIAHIAGTVAQRGLDYYLQLIAMLSISLFLINLLPIPILDGGHIVYALIEMVTRRRVSLRVQRAASMAGMAILGCLLVLVIYNDLTRLAGG